IKINGCLVSPYDLTLKALPMTLVTTPPLQQDSESHVVHEARITGTPDPHTFSFVFDSLSPTRAYKLTIRLDSLTGHTGPGPCQKVTWIGPRRGIIIPNSKRLVELKGFALTTQIEVGTARGFAGAEALTYWSSLRNFRWRSELPGVASAE